MEIEKPSARELVEAYVAACDAAAAAKDDADEAMLKRHQAESARQRAWTALKVHDDTKPGVYIVGNRALVVDYYKDYPWPETICQ